MDERDLERPAERRAEIHVPYRMDDSMIEDLRTEDEKLQAAVRNLNKLKRRFNTFNMGRYFISLFVIQTIPKVLLEVIDKSYFEKFPLLDLLIKFADSVSGWGYVIYTIARCKGYFDFVIDNKFKREVNNLGNEIAERLHKKWKAEDRVKDEILDDEEERKPRLIIH